VCLTDKTNFIERLLCHNVTLILRVPSGSCIIVIIIIIMFMKG